jgi:hypothetical protein
MKWQQPPSVETDRGNTIQASNRVNIDHFIKSHWLEWISTAGVVALAWIGTNAVGKPITKFWSDRTAALLAVQEHGGVSYRASQERVESAKVALRASAAAFRVYSQSGPLAVRTYALLRGYDLGLAGRAMNGLHDLVGENADNEGLRNNADAVRICLGATANLTRQRVKQVRRMIERGTGGSLS